MLSYLFRLVALFAFAIILNVSVVSAASADCISDKISDQYGVPALEQCAESLNESDIIGTTKCLSNYLGLSISDVSQKMYLWINQCGPEETEKFFTDRADDVKDFFEGTSNEIVEGGQAAVDKTKEVANDVKDLAEDTGKQALDKTKETANEVKDFAEETANDVKDVAKDAGNEIVDTGKEAVDKTKEAANTVVGGLKRFFH